jgi:hypothetical protein
MSNSMNTEANLSDTFGNSAHSDDNMGDEAAYPPADVTYFVSGRYGEVDLPPNVKTQSVIVAAPTIPRGGDYDII